MEGISLVVGIREWFLLDKSFKCSLYSLIQVIREQLWGPLFRAKMFFREALHYDESNLISFILKREREGSDSYHHHNSNLSKRERDSDREIYRNQTTFSLLISPPSFSTMKNLSYKRKEKQI